MLRKTLRMKSAVTRTHEINFPSHAISIVWEKGERILVEISRKFEPELLQKQLHLFGLKLIAHFTDPKEWFSLLLFQKTGVTLT